MEQQLYSGAAPGVPWRGACGLRRGGGAGEGARRRDCAREGDRGADAHVQGVAGRGGLLLQVRLLALVPAAGQRHAGGLQRRDPVLGRQVRQQRSVCLGPLGPVTY